MLDLIQVSRIGQNYGVLPDPPALGGPYNIGTEEKPHFVPDLTGGVNSPANIAWFAHAVRVILQMKKIPVSFHQV